MSDAIKHECGIALIRLKKPLSYYQEKYGTALFGINKMYLMMENSTIEVKMVQVLQVLNSIWSQENDTSVEFVLVKNNPFKIFLIKSVLEFKND